MEIYELFDLDITNKIFEEIKSDSKAQVKAFEDRKTIFFSNYEKGISYCFEGGKLNSVFFYNEGIQHFSLCKSKIPYGISIDKAKIYEIIQYLGDTPKKGGGKYPIFLTYLHLGLEITFLGPSWEDKDNTIAYVSSFKPKKEFFCAVCTKSIQSLNFSCDYCNILFYCSLTCKNYHITFHSKHCSKIRIKY